MQAPRLALAAALLAAFGLVHAADAPIPSRTHVEDVVAEVAATTPTSITIKYQAVVPTGKVTGRGKNARPQVKAEEKEEKFDVIDKVVVKDSKAKEGKGDYNSIAVGQVVKLHIAKETIRVPNEKPSSKLVVTQIDIVHTADGKPLVKPDAKGEAKPEKK